MHRLKNQLFSDGVGDMKNHITNKSPHLFYVGASCLAALCSGGGGRVYRFVNPGLLPSALDMYALSKLTTNILKTTGKSLYLQGFGDI